MKLFQFFAPPPPPDSERPLLGPASEANVELNSCSGGDEGEDTAVESVVSDGEDADDDSALCTGLPGHSDSSGAALVGYVAAAVDACVGVLPLLTPEGN